jgi:hypothetical protein
MNNCYSDYAVRAARTLSAQLMAHQRASGLETLHSDDGSPSRPAVGVPRGAFGPIPPHND